MLIRAYKVNAPQSRSLSRGDDLRLSSGKGLVPRDQPLTLHNDRRQAQEGRLLILAVWFTSFCASVARAPQNIAATRCVALPGSGPGAELSRRPATPPARRYQPAGLLPAERGRQQLRIQQDQCTPEGPRRLPNPPSPPGPTEHLGPSASRRRISYPLRDRGHRIERWFLPAGERSANNGGADPADMVTVRAAQGTLSHHAGDEPAREAGQALPHWPRSGSVADKRTKPSGFTTGGTGEGRTRTPRANRVPPRCPGADVGMPTPAHGLDGLAGLGFCSWPSCLGPPSRCGPPLTNSLEGGPRSSRLLANTRHDPLAMAPADPSTCCCERRSNTSPGRRT